MRKKPAVRVAPFRAPLKAEERDAPPLARFLENCLSHGGESRLCCSLNGYTRVCLSSVPPGEFIASDGEIDQCVDGGGPGGHRSTHDVVSAAQHPVPHDPHDGNACDGLIGRRPLEKRTDPGRKPCTGGGKRLHRADSDELAAPVFDELHVRSAQRQAKRNFQPLPGTTHDRVVDEYTGKCGALTRHKNAGPAEAVPFGGGFQSTPHEGFVVVESRDARDRVCPKAQQPVVE